MRTIKELKKAVKYNVPLVWNDPDSIEGNDYTISKIEDLKYVIYDDEPIYIEYNNGCSEASVFLYEIDYKK